MTKPRRVVIVPALMALAWPVSSQAPSLDDVLKRAREAVARYETQAALLVGDEQCEQKAFEGRVERSNATYGFTGDVGRTDPRGRRKWQAEVALLRTSDVPGAAGPWLELRGMTRVDGRPPDGGQQTPTRLFLADTGWSVPEAKAIAAASARFYLTSLPRVVNTPSSPLLVLHPANAARFSFEKRGEDSVDGTRAWKIDYRELRAPTVFSTGDAPCGASGTFWIDPANGEIVRAMLLCFPSQAPESVDKITVSYRRDPKLGVRVPFEMVERPEGPSGRESFGGGGTYWVEGKCTYSNFRRYETVSKMKVPR